MSLPLRVPQEQGRRRPARGVALRASVVVWRGRAALLPGRGRGTSTLVQALLRAGATCLSEEVAHLDEEGCVDGTPVGFVWLTRYEPGAIPSAARLSDECGAFALRSHAVSPRRSGRVLTRLPVWEGDRGEAEVAARWLLAVLDVTG